MIDSHSHIYTGPYQSDQAEVIEKARKSGMTQLLQVGCNLDESKQALELAIKTRGIYASVGVHPHDASTWNNDVASELVEMVSHRKVLAYGEIGLDFYYDNSPRETQISVFKLQMELVQNLKKELPVVIHTRDAEPETLDVLRSYKITRGGHVHCYTGTLKTAQDILDLGFHIGFTGVITFKNAEALRAVVKIVPIERILIETDSPYLTPVPHRGKRNEPAFVEHVAEAIAQVKGMSKNQVIEQTSSNFHELYGQPDMVWESL